MQYILKIQPGIKAYYQCVFVRALCRFYQILVVELKKSGDVPPLLTDKTITRYYHNRTRGEPYITAVFDKDEFSEEFTIGDGTRYSAARRRRKRAAGIGNRVMIIDFNCKWCPDIFQTCMI